MSWRLWTDAIAVKSFTEEHIIQRARNKQQQQRQAAVRRSGKQARVGNAEIKVKDKDKNRIITRKTTQ